MAQALPSFLVVEGVTLRQLVHFQAVRQPLEVAAQQGLMVMEIIALIYLKGPGLGGLPMVAVAMLGQVVLEVVQAPMGEMELNTMVHTGVVVVAVVVVLLAVLMLRVVPVGFTVVVAGGVFLFVGGGEGVCGGKWLY